MKGQVQFPGFENLRLSTTYKFVREGLLEKAGSQFVLYGDWNRLFGCWVKVGNSPAVEVSPDWRIFSANGLLRELEDVTAIRNLAVLEGADMPLGAKAWRRFREHFDSIPRILRLTICGMHRHQWAMMDMASQVRGFSWYLYEEGQSERLGFVTACYSLATIEGPLSRMGRREFAEGIIKEKRRDFLSKVSGRECENRHVKFLQKLSFTTNGVDIRRYLRATEDEEVALVLNHAKRVRADLANAALYLPTGFFHQNIRLLLDVISLERLCRCVAEITGLLGEDQVPAAGIAFSRIRNEDEFWNWHETWEWKAAEVSDFPKPPLHLQMPLEPITSFNRLAQEGANMHNCSPSYWRRIVTGDVYFYHWHGEEEATLCIGIDNAGNWDLHEALGFANEDLSDETFERIAEAIRGEEIIDTNLQNSMNFLDGMDEDL